VVVVVVVVVVAVIAVVVVVVVVVAVVAMVVVVVVVVVAVAVVAVVAVEMQADEPSCAATEQTSVLCVKYSEAIRDHRRQLHIVTDLSKSI
jgi:hypothetical protein